MNDETLPREPYPLAERLVKRPPVHQLIHSLLGKKDAEDHLSYHCSLDGILPAIKFSLVPQHSIHVPLRVSYKATYCFLSRGHSAMNSYIWASFIKPLLFTTKKVRLPILVKEKFRLVPMAMKVKALLQMSLMGQKSRRTREELTLRDRGVATRIRKG